MVTVSSSVFLYHVRRFLNDEDALELVSTCQYMLSLFKKHPFVLRDNDFCLSEDSRLPIQVVLICRISQRKTVVQKVDYTESPFHVARAECTSRDVNTFYENTYSRRIYPLFSTLTHLSINIAYTSLSPCVSFEGLESLKLMGNFPSFASVGVSIPTTLTRLSFQCKTKLMDLTLLQHVHNCALDLVKHTNLTSLSLGDMFTSAIRRGDLPASLIHLDVGNSFNRPIQPNILPEGLKEIVLGDGFNQLLTPGVFPSTVTCISIGRRFNQPLTPGVFPSSLTSLSFGRGFNQPLVVDVFPSSLLRLVTGFMFHQGIKEGVVPPTIEKIVIEDVPENTRPNYDSIHVGTLSGNRQKKDVVHVIYR